MDSKGMVQIINGVRYDTDKAQVIAHDRYWDGRNMEKCGRNTYLFRGRNGGYFSQHLTRWDGERDHLEALTRAEAIELYEQLQEHEVEFEAAFPGVEVKEA